MSVTTKDLNRSLGKKELFSVAVGQIIGGGIMALTGMAIGMTGRSANISFILAAIAILILSIPMIFITSTVRMRGGQYTQAAVFIGQKFAGMFIVIFIITNISLAMFALSFADYFIALVPGAPRQLVAAILLTVIFVVNFFGVGKAATLQRIMVIILAVSLIAFAGFGIVEVQPGYFEQPGFITNGLTGVLTAMALLTFATGGATVVLNLSAEAKNPKVDIPIIVIVSTISVAVLYAFMATVAAGVLPLEQVANQPLTHVAQVIFPNWLYIFFIIGGAMFALISTLNAQVSWMTKPIMQACVDNWFPPYLAKLHPKYNTPYILLGLLYIVGMVPILTGLDIDFIASSALIMNYVIMIVLTIGTLRLPKLYPELWEKSTFHVKGVAFYVICILATLVTFLQIALMFGTLDTKGIIANIVVLIIAVLFGLTRDKKVNMEISIEEE